MKSNILTFELIFNNLEELDKKNNEIEKLFADNVIIYIILYILKGIICMPTNSHYTVYLYNIKENDFLL